MKINLLDIPYDVLQVIGNQLDTSSKSNMSSTCKLFREVIQDPDTTTMLDFSSHPHITNEQFENFIQPYRGKITHLSLRGCHNISAHVVQNFLLQNGAASLKYLDIRGCTNTCNRTLSIIAKICPNIEALAIGKCQGTLEEGMDALALKCHQLQTLVFCNMNFYRDNQPLSFALERILSLCTLVFERAQGLHPLDIINTVQNCPNLQTLSIQGANKLDDETVDSISKACPTLRHLEISNCVHVSGATITNFLDAHPLETLTVGGRYCCMSKRFIEEHILFKNYPARLYWVQGKAT